MELCNIPRRCRSRPSVPVVTSEFLGLSGVMAPKSRHGEISGLSLVEKHWQRTGWTLDIDQLSKNDGKLGA